MHLRDQDGTLGISGAVKVKHLWESRAICSASMQPFHASCARATAWRGLVTRKQAVNNN